MTTKVFSVSQKGMNKALGLTTNDMTTLDIALKENGYLRLDTGFNPGNQIHYIKTPDNWTDEMLTLALPQLALVRTAITIASTMGTLEDHSAGQIADRFVTDNEAAKELIDVQLAFSKENCAKEYSQPIRETYNFDDNNLGNFAAWSMRISPRITNQMLRRSADLTGLHTDIIQSHLPPQTEIGDDLAPEIMKIWEKGLNAKTSELYHWFRLNPAVESPRYTRFAIMLGLDPTNAWQEVDTWLRSSSQT